MVTRLREYDIMIINIVISKDKVNYCSDNYKISPAVSKEVILEAAGGATGDTGLRGRDEVHRVRTGRATN
jgi:hypothetical protein